ncbi:M3 family metallopeptidase [Sphingosinicella rhizophila]|uniref:M3 family metallopeptidase n=1 Tax=Sphingosinicella rhizophila TaxID=3050082 RepID=A0ABU3QAX4_9SPHN|nr:M3 family metallopeptidase [Sphingosinicella sp. GR2756]MDT9600289.1 M3 family metallopeptidase [Sphingosinicella sp. GR2756]
MKAIFLTAATALALGGYPVMDDANIGSAAAATVTAGQADNILLEDWRGPYGGIPPFDRVEPALFPAALQFAIDEQRREVLAITDNSAAPSFANTVEALEKVGERLDRVLSVFGVMSSNMANPEIQAIDRTWSPKLSAASDEITLDPKLFARVKKVYETRTESGLDAIQQRLVTRLYDSFVRRGANLDAARKAQLSEYNQQLAAAFAEFNQKLLADETTHIAATEAEMKGVPADVKAAAAAAAGERNLPAGSYAIVNTRSAVDPVLTFADDRALREKVWRAFVNRGDNGDANDTNALIARIVKLRADRARLLGFASHAEWRMQDTMAKTPAKAMDLMMRVWPAAIARVKEEVRDQQAIADGLGHKISIEPWDYRYYQEKVRKQRYDLTQDEVKPYFELDNIIEASYWAAGELYGLDFKEVTGTVPVWHPDIRVYSVTDRKDGRQVGLFYRDDYARSGKRSGAWMTTYRSRARLLGDDIVLASNNNNFVKPAPGQPVLISLDDAATLFHEFGHAIHYLLVDVKYPSFGSTPRDFVEYPSQVNENWLLTQPVLSRFAKHYRTGQPIPQALIDKIRKADTFNQGFGTTEYLSSAIVDMMLHMDPNGAIDPDSFERETLAKIGMPDQLVMRHRLPQFGHLFSSDAYSAGYYSYLWSETMDADTWAAFEEAGDPFDKATADRFRETLLATGNETDRAEAYRAFRGRDPDVNALLKKRGFPVK